MALRTMKPAGLSEVMKFAQKVEGKECVQPKETMRAQGWAAQGTWAQPTPLFFLDREAYPIHTSHWPIPTQFKASPFTHRLVSPSLNPYPPTRLDQHPPSNPNLNFPLPVSARPYKEIPSTTKSPLMQNCR